jgi:beta-galactosidase
VRVDVVPLSAPIEEYDLVVAPILHVVPEALSKRLTAFVENGGHLVTTYFSGIVDENDHVWLGGYPGALRDLLGIRVEEFAPLLDDERITLDNDATALLWTERVDLASPETEVLASYREGDLAGRPAITRRPVGAGSAAYVSTRLGPDGLAPVLGVLLRRAGVDSELPAALRGRVELAVRDGVRFVINRTDEPVDLGDLAGAPATLDARGVAVFRT